MFDQWIVAGQLIQRTLLQRDSKQQSDPQQQPTRMERCKTASENSQTLYKGVALPPVERFRCNLSCMDCVFMHVYSLVT